MDQNQQKESEVKLGNCKICLVRRAGAVEHDRNAQVIKIPDICTSCYTAVYLIKDAEMLKRFDDYMVVKFGSKKEEKIN